MRKCILMILVPVIVLLSGTAYSLTNFWQTGVSYDNIGQIVDNANIDVRITISNSGNQNLYQQTFTGIATGQFAVFQVEVDGSADAVAFAAIDADASTRIKVETSTDGGTTWVMSAMSSLTQVQYNTIIIPGNIEVTEHHIIMGDVDDNGENVAVGGDLTAQNNGIGTAVFTIADGAVTSAKILDGTIVDDDVSGTAAIAVSKLAGGSNMDILYSNGTTPTWGSVTDIIQDLTFGDGLATWHQTYDGTTARTVSVKLADATLLNPTDGSGISLNLGNANTWTATQTFSTVDIDGGNIDNTVIGTNSEADAHVDDFWVEGYVMTALTPNPAAVALDIGSDLVRWASGFFGSHSIHIGENRAITDGTGENVDLEWDENNDELDISKTTHIAGAFWVDSFFDVTLDVNVGGTFGFDGGLPTNPEVNKIVTVIDDNDNEALPTEGAVFDAVTDIAGAPFLTFASDIDGVLSDNRILAAGDGIAVMDAGTDDGAATVSVVTDRSTVDINTSHEVYVPEGGITSNEIADGTIVDDDINPSAGIDVSKLHGGTAGDVLYTPAGGIPDWAELAAVETDPQVDDNNWNDGDFAMWDAINGYLTQAPIHDDGTQILAAEDFLPASGNLNLGSNTARWAGAYIHSDHGMSSIHLGVAAGDEVIIGYSGNPNYFMTVDRSIIPTGGILGQKDLGTQIYPWDNVYATTFTGALVGNASTATTLETARNFAVSGDVATAAAVSFNGSGNVDLSVSFASGVIVDEDINAGAEIDVSKLGDGDAGQIIVTGAGGTTVGWADVSNVMADLTDGNGIVDFSYDGSSAATVTVDHDGTLVSTAGVANDQLSLNLGNANTWTATQTFDVAAGHSAVFADAIDVQGNITNSTGDVTIDGDLILSIDGHFSLGNLTHRWEALYAYNVFVDQIKTHTSVLGEVSSNDKIYMNGMIATNIIPDQDGVHSLGISGSGWDVVYATSFEGTARRAIYLVGGGEGQLVYQSNTDATTFLAVGTDGQFLTYDGTNHKPQWSTFTETDPLWINAEPNYANLGQAETITGDWNNTAHPWADNEVADNLTITGGTVDNTIVGGTTAAAGTFTALLATGNTTLGDDATADVTTMNSALVTKYNYATGVTATQTIPDGTMVYDLVIGNSSVGGYTITLPSGTNGQILYVHLDYDGSGNITINGTTYNADANIILVYSGGSWLTF